MGKESDRPLQEPFNSNAHQMSRSNQYFRSIYAS